MRGVKSGHTIVMMGTHPRGQGGIAAVADQYLVHKDKCEYSLLYLSTHEAGSVLKILLAYLGSVLHLLSLLLRHRVVLVHVHCASRGSFFRKSIILALARSFSVPTVLHLHGGGFVEFYQGVRHQWLRSWIRRSFELSSQVIVLSESWLERVTAIAPGARVTVLPNAVSFVESYDAQVGPRESIGPDVSPFPRVLFAGRIDRLKGVEDLVQALPQIAKKFPNARLVFAGSGQIDRLKALISELEMDAHVELLDWVSSEELGLQLRACTVFALPSYAEGLPMAMLEAMAHGKPIVVSPVGGIPEAVKHLESAVFVKPGSVTEIAEAVIKIASDPEFARRIGGKAKECVERRYGLDEHFVKLNQLYRGLLAIKP